MANSTRAKSRRKPSKAFKPVGKPDFPLFGHKGSGYWAKKVLGKLVYFGKIKDDPTGQAAIDLWIDQKDNLLAGRGFQAKREGLTVEDLCDHFTTFKESQRDSGEIAKRTYDDYFDTCNRLIESLGASRLVADLRPEDFAKLRAKMAAQWGVVTLSNEITRIRVVFKFGLDNEHMQVAARFGKAFDKPKRKVLKKARKPNRMFEPKELHRLLHAAGPQLKTMILLGLNCGFGNGDVGQLPISALDLKGGWVRFPRPKTDVDRKCKLWPETVKRLKRVVAGRPAEELVFVTKYGGSWAKDTRDNPVSKEFRKLLDSLDLYRPGLSFYTLRHVFETVAGESTDQVGVDAVMGHSARDDDMGARYREKLPSDARLEAVANHVRSWLFAREGGAK